MYFSFQNLTYQFFLQVQGGVDFSAAELDPDTGLMCVFKEIQVDTLEKEPILECTHQ